MSPTADCTCAACGESRGSWRHRLLYAGGILLVTVFVVLLTWAAGSLVERLP